LNKIYANKLACLGADGKPNFLFNIVTFDLATSRRTRYGSSIDHWPIGAHTRPDIMNLDQLSDYSGPRILDKGLS